MLEVGVVESGWLAGWVPRGVQQDSWAGKEEEEALLVVVVQMRLGQEVGVKT